MASLFCEKWTAATGRKVEWRHIMDSGPHEAKTLTLDCSKIRSQFGWEPIWNIDNAIDKVVEWECGYIRGADMLQIMSDQIGDYIACK